MNERIRELSEQAEKYADEWFRGEPTWSEAFETQFAELIIRECMWKIMYRKEQAIDNNWGVDEAMSAALSDISEHFGAEE